MEECQAPPEALTLCSVPQVHLCFPEEGLVYDYRLDDAGIDGLGEDDKEKERKASRVVSS